MFRRGAAIAPIRASAAFCVSWSFLVLSAGLTRAKSRLILLAEEDPGEAMPFLLKDANGEPKAWKSEHVEVRSFPQKRSRKKEARASPRASRGHPLWHAPELASATI